MEKLQGFVAARDLQTGPGSGRQTCSIHPCWCEKEESVTVRAQPAGITIAATMRAKSDARFGDTIAVEHLSGPGGTSARVIGTRTLETLSNRAQPSTEGVK
jgi:flagella basal body P-ring formation protein FlgA